jgi:phosphoribosylanthranilate isomerase
LERIGNREVLTQIYEVSTTEEARSLCRIGIDHVGILVGKGEFPREQTLDTALTIAGVVRTPSKVSTF